MSDSVEDLLAQVKAKYNQSELPIAPPLPPCPPSATPASIDAPAADAIENLLADLQAPSLPKAHSPHSRVTASAHPPLDAIAGQGTVTNHQPPPHSSAATPNTDPLLAHLKAQYAAQDQAEALKRQQQQQAEQQHQAQAQRRRQQALVQRAEAWLKTLDTRSGESAWFEAFAANYESRVAAAIDYLKASEEA
ncbi:hypothetical protein IFO70_25795 [Phormidium tenue FACHB-886]|nr:hypothetical protein [Phormidium tenue FACHB-886]